MFKWLFGGAKALPAPVSQELVVQPQRQIDLSQFLVPQDQFLAPRGRVDILPPRPLRVIGMCQVCGSPLTGLRSIKAQAGMICALRNNLPW